MLEEEKDWNEEPKTDAPEEEETGEVGNGEPGEEISEETPEESCEALTEETPGETSEETPEDTSEEVPETAQESPDEQPGQPEEEPEDGSAGTAEEPLPEEPAEGSMEESAEAPAPAAPEKTRREPDLDRIEKTVRLTRTVNFVLMGVLLLVVVALGVLFVLAANGYLYGKVLGDPAKGQIDAAAVAEQSMPAIVIVENATRTGSALGTGFLFREDGYILTNAHVLEDSLSVQVEFRDGRKVPATIVGMRTLEDVAVLKIEGTGYPTLPIGKSNEVMAGESVIAIGTAGSKQYAFTVTRGIVSCPDRDVRIYDSQGKLTKRATMVQFDANATNGNSGGPLINARGQVIGIVTLKASATTVDYLNMAIPITGAVELANAMIEEGGNAEQVTSAIAEGRPLLGVVAYTYGVQADGKYFLVNDDKGNMAPVMLVEADAPLLLRGTVKGVYTGVSWTDEGAREALVKVCRVFCLAG